MQASAVGEKHPTAAHGVSYCLLIEERQIAMAKGNTNKCLKE